MSYELLQSHLQSTMHTLNHSKIGKKNQGAHKKTDKKNGAAKPTVHKTTKSTINKKKISNIEKAEREIKSSENRMKQVIKKLESEASIRKHSIGDIMKIVKLHQKR